MALSGKMNKDQLKAAVCTLFFAAITIGILLATHLSIDIMPEPEKKKPELATIEEEIFIEPKLLNLGEKDATANDEPEPVQQGEPEPAPKDNDRLVEPGKNPKPAPQKPKLVSSKKESPVKTMEPSVTKQERSKITSSMAKGFSGQNGQVNGKNGSSGSGGEGAGIKGYARGRMFRGCPKPDVTLRHKVTVTVTVTVNEQGNVTSATAQGGASAAIRRACEQAARQARWSPKKGAGETRGTITFTITPRV